MADETTTGSEPPAEKPKYDQAFFLALAAKGKDAWNAWRRDPTNKDVRVIFASIDFGQTPWDKINFAGFEFGDEADFSGCKWRGGKREQDPEAFKLGQACFTGAAFGDEANFAGSAFGSCAKFTGAAFGDWATFVGAAFGNEADFPHAAFGHHATFTGSAFGHKANFSQTHFKGLVWFTGKSEDQWTEYFESIFGSGTDVFTELKQRHKELRKRNDSGPGRFLILSFANARFDGEAVFSGRSFDSTADFTHARFCYPPDFDAATNVARVDFTGAHIGFVPPGKLHWTSKSQVPIRLRAFRKIAEETKNHDLERVLYVEERKAERGVYLVQCLEDLIKEPVWKWPGNAMRLMIHILWLAVMGVYWLLADYGRSFALPATWLALSVSIFQTGYDKVLAPLMHEAGPANADRYNHAVWMLAFGNAVPFVGPLTIDADIKKVLFCPTGNATCLPPIPPEFYQLLVLGQNLVSIILVFFIGLALRNYFKIK